MCVFCIKGLQLVFCNTAPLPCFSTTLSLFTIIQLFNVNLLRILSHTLAMNDQCLRQICSQHSVRTYLVLLCLRRLSYSPQHLI